MGTTETVTLSVEVEEKFRPSGTGLYGSHFPAHLTGWVNTYAEAYDNGIELMARYEGIGNFSVIKEYQRAEPVAEPD